MGQAAARTNRVRRACVGSIPDDWDVVSVAEIVDRKPNAIVGGPFGSDLVSTDYVPSGIPVIRGANMSTPTVAGDFVFVSEAKGKSLSANMAGPGDVVFTQRGTLGQVAIVPDGPFEMYLISQSQMKLSANGDVIHKPYLLHYFASFAGQKQILDSAIQTGVPHTNLSILRNYALPLPPMVEQEAIAEALSDADALIEGLERLIAKKRLIKQGAMQDLLTAKRRLPGFSGKWEIKRLAEIGQVKTGLTYSPTNVSPYGTLVLRSSNIQQDRLAFDSNVFVDLDVSDEATVRSGDLLICVRNGSRQLIGKTAIIDDRADGMAFGAFMSAYRSDLNTYLIWCFQSSVIQKQVAEHLGATINQITNATLKGIEVPIPEDPDERAAISAVLTDMDAEIQALETRLEKARQVKEGMMQNLLTGRIRLV